MKNVRSIVMALGGSAKVAKSLKKPQPTVCSWMARNSIPYKHWKAICWLAWQRGLRYDITIETLMDMHI